MRYRKRKIAGVTYSEHRLVYEQANGSIPTGHVVHHRNHDPLDNRSDNLEALTHAAHSRHHNQKHPLTRHCVVCGVEFAPAPTKRARAQTCSDKCRWARIAESNRERRGGSCRSCGAKDHRTPGCPRVLGVDLAALRAAHLAGESLRSIGRRLGLHHSRIRKLLDNNNVWVAPHARALVA